MKALTMTASGLTSGEMAENFHQRVRNYAGNYAKSATRHFRLAKALGAAGRWGRDTVCITVSALALAVFFRGLLLGSFWLTTLSGLTALLAVAVATSGEPELKIKNEKLNSASCEEGGEK